MHTHHAASPTIRDGCDADSWDLIGLIAACWAEYPGCVLDVHGEEPWLLAPATALTATGGRLWVAESAGRVVGCIALRPTVDSETLELKSLYVARTARRAGLASRLVALVEQEAAGLGARQVALWSDTRFLDAHALYRRLGYREGGTRSLADLSRSVESYFCKLLTSDAAPG